ncbi:DUF892 family protein [Ralstonia chuxiongensis]|uniref:DUF892 family protein n=1 Tax=Ralstonia chuxiongensis TaxID=2957504 RepID=UPI0028F6446D|nr:DUF892 family protein [Ralstonia chuxiongensis]CAJ0780339.1 hypothetical protein R8510_04731 [Ralstonia chuxiongensis]
MAARIAAFGQGLGGVMVPGAAGCGARALYVHEHLKRAAYTVLRARAMHDGDNETVRMCDDLLPKVQAMAAWLEECLPGVTGDFVARTDTWAPMGDQGDPGNSAGPIPVRDDTRTSCL